MHPFHFGSDLRPAQDEPNLRTVAMTDRQVPACLDHIDDVVRRLAQSLLLIFHGDVLAVPDQRVAANGDYS